MTRAKFPPWLASDVSVGSTALSKPGTRAATAQIRNAHQGSHSKGMGAAAISILCMRAEPENGPEEIHVTPLPGFATTSAQVSSHVPSTADSVSPVLFRGQRLDVELDSQPCLTVPVV